MPPEVSRNSSSAWPILCICTPNGRQNVGDTQTRILPDIETSTRPRGGLDSLPMSGFEIMIHNSVQQVSGKRLRCDGVPTAHRLHELSRKGTALSELIVTYIINGDLAVTCYTLPTLSEHIPARCRIRRIEDRLKGRLPGDPDQRYPLVDQDILDCLQIRMSYPFPVGRKYLTAPLPNGFEFSLPLRMLPHQPGRSLRYGSGLHSNCIEKSLARRDSPRINVECGYLTRCCHDGNTPFYGYYPMLGMPMHSVVAERNDNALSSSVLSQRFLGGPDRRAGSREHQCRAISDAGSRPKNYQRTSDSGR
jgi:hypothetical protein